MHWIVLSVKASDATVLQTLSLLDQFKSSEENQNVQNIKMAGEPFIWTRFIDDVFFMWIHGVGRLSLSSLILNSNLPCKIATNSIFPIMNIGIPM